MYQGKPHKYVKEWPFELLLWFGGLGFREFQVGLALGAMSSNWFPADLSCVIFGS